MAPKVSIIMSVYNEPKAFIIDCIESITKQTFSDFEVIVVLDKPERYQELYDLIQQKGDNRFRLHCNEKNLGLAMSMNVAASISSSDILARMDADDVCLPNRLEIEYDTITQGYDVVFSKYVKIDEAGNIISDEIIPAASPTPQQISKSLVYRNSYIHHPTVMMKKTALRAVEGYRDFPCSQDFDLWLRMNEKGLSFYMCEEPLLYYRVNSSSISSQKWFQQRLTVFYIFKLSVKRLIYSSDNFSSQAYKSFLRRNGIDSPYAQKRLKEAINTHSYALELKKNGKRIRCFLLQVKSLFHSISWMKYNSYLVTKRIVLSVKEMF